MKQIFLCILLAFGIIGCKSPNREIIDSFEEVNKSLEQSNDFNTWSIDKLYRSIKSKTKRNGKYLSQADTIYRIVRGAINFLEKQRHNLILLDSTGERIDVASGALIESPAGGMEHSTIFVII